MHPEWDSSPAGKYHIDIKRKDTIKGLIYLYATAKTGCTLRKSRQSKLCFQIKTLHYIFGMAKYPVEILTLSDYYMLFKYQFGSVHFIKSYNLDHKLFTSLICERLHLFVL